MRITTSFIGFVCVLLCISSNDIPLYAQGTYVPSEGNLRVREAFRDMKFGMFVHWGIYSILADGEWVMNNKKIPKNDYAKLASFFYPYAFNAKEWVRTAKSAGMKYITITSRHHDGFSMFQTKATPYNIVDATPYEKDPLKELAEACKSEGIKLFFYYSLVDWYRDDYGFGQRIINGRPERADWDSYIEFVKTQLTELLTNYPDIAGIWFDGDWERPNVNWHYNELYGLIHRIKPDALIGNNHHLLPKPGEDFQMFEKDLPGSNTFGENTKDISSLPLETCETMNNHWGFDIKDRNYKTVKQLIHYLINAAGRNANFLLNVGPMPNGKIQQEFVDTLAAVGRWIAQYGETIYDTRSGFLPPQEWGVTTQKNGIQYIHILNMPEAKFLFIPNVKQTIRSAKILDTKSPVNFNQTAEGITIYLDGLNRNVIDTIIEVDIK
jgi:alpha-L-fucosidase